MFGNEFANFLAKIPGATTVTIKHRSTEYFGAPVCVAGSGGTITAGTYYVRANPVKSAVEYQMGDQTQVVVGATGTIAITLPNLGSGVTFNVYVSTINSLSFPASALAAASQAAGVYTYTGSALSAGTPVESARDPYVVWSSTSAQCVKREQRNTTDTRALQEGFGPIEQFRLTFSPTETIANGDFVVIDGLEYSVENVKSGLIFGSTAKLLVAQVQRGRLQ